MDVNPGGRDRVGWQRCVAALVVAAVAIVIPGSGAAQDGDRGGAAPYVDVDHWTRDALRRLEALGLLGHDYDPGAWTLDRVQVARLLEAAHERAEGDPALVGLIEDYSARLSTEFPGAYADRDGFRRGVLEGSAGFLHADGELLTAVGWPPDADGWPELPEVLPTPLPRRNTVTGAIDASAYYGSTWAGRLRLEASADGVELGEGYVRWDPGRASVWLGRRSLALGPGVGGIVLSGGGPLDGGGLDIEPFRLPWVLGYLGPTRFHMALARLGEVVPYDGPLLWALRGSVQPHPRLTLGVNRGIMVPNPDEMTAEWLVQLPLVLIGKHPDGELNRQDNQIVSVDLAYNAPLPSLPVMLYLEWGFEDSAGAWKAVPGIVAGAYVPRLPGVEWLAAGVEHASFSEMCCGNPWWYRHRGFRGGWTNDREPLGHALGGHGRESSIQLDGAAWGERLRTGLVVYHRDRGIENLFSPTREGASTGGALRASLLWTPRYRVRVEVEHERGAEWRRTGLSVVAGMLF